MASNVWGPLSVDPHPPKNNTTIPRPMYFLANAVGEEAIIIQKIGGWGLKPSDS